MKRWMKKKTAVAALALGLGTAIVPQPAHAIFVGLFTSPVVYYVGIATLLTSYIDHSSAQWWVGVLLDENNAPKNLSGDQVSQIALVEGYSKDDAAKFAQDVDLMNRYIDSDHSVQIDLKPLRDVVPADRAHFESTLKQVVKQGADDTNAAIQDSASDRGEAPVTSSVRPETIRFLLSLNGV